MTDRWAVALALAIVAGAVIGVGPSPWLGGGLCLAALAVRRPALLTIAALLLSGGLSARAEAGLVPVVPGSFSGWVTVLTDPEAGRAGLAADARLADGRHVRAEASNTAEDELRSAAAGERLLLVGRLERPPPRSSWLADRHVVGVLAVDAVRARSPGAPWMQAANGLRAVLERGAIGLPERERALFLGFVLGDTRDQPPDITDDFRGAGLSHLLAVSGQNVAFALALAGPLLRRLGLRARLPATLAVIGFFALMTRFEPSVLRASAMAALVVTATTLGRETSSLRALALAVGGLVLVDPFLVWSVGFQLSVAACAGIACLSPVIARRLPGPRGLADALSVTLGAQAGVAPLLVAVFGGVPVAAVPANLLSAPAEGPVMVWGLGAGVVAGLAGGRVTTVVHWPTHVLIAWIAAVAHRAAALPLGELHGPELSALAVGAVVMAIGRRPGMAGLTRAAAALMALALIAPAEHLRERPSVRTAVGAGAVLWRDGGTALDLDGRVDPGDLLQALRRQGVTGIDVVVARTDSTTVRATVDALRRRYSIGRVLTPATTTVETSSVVGRLVVDARPVAGRLTVEVTVQPPGSARGPPV